MLAGPQHVLEGERRRPHHARARPQAADPDPQLARGQRRGAAVDRLADAGQQRLGGLRQVAAHDDHPRSGDADDPPPGRRPARARPRARGARPCGWPAWTSATSSRVEATSHPFLGKLPDDRPAPDATAPDATAVAAGAQRIGGRAWPGCGRCRPRGPRYPRSSSPSVTTPAPMPVRDLHEDQVRDGRARSRRCSPSAIALTSRSTHHGRPEARGEVVGDREGVPAGHHRGAHRPARGDVDRPRQADAGGQDVPRGCTQPRPAARRRSRPTQASTASGPSRDADRLLALRQRDAGQVADGQAPVHGAEVGSEHHAGTLVEAPAPRAGALRGPRRGALRLLRSPGRRPAVRRARCMTVDRERPVESTSSVRVPAPPARITPSKLARGSSHSDRVGRHDRRRLYPRSRRPCRDFRVSVAPRSPAASGCKSRRSSP